MYQISDRELVKSHLISDKADRLSDEQREELIQEIKALLIEKQAVLVAHYYTDPILQQLAEETGGCVADSLEMARFGANHPANTLVVAGVRFMGETSKILSPEKTVLMPTLEAECSLDLGCPIEAFEDFCDQHSDRTVVVYANTSAAVKARADWVVTSSCANEIVQHLSNKGESILWAPDQHLGRYIQSQTKADMLLWQGSCIVHEEFRALGIERMKSLYPEAGVLVHPESPTAVIELADAVGSTSQLIQAAKSLPHKSFIVATDRGIFYRMQAEAPGKSFIEAPTGGTSATCRSCANCPWMAMNQLQNLKEALIKGAAPHTIEVDESIRIEAVKSLQRMLDFTVKA